MRNEARALAAVAAIWAPREALDTVPSSPEELS